MALFDNEKQPAAEQVDGKLYLPVGYPLGYDLDNKKHENLGNNVHRWQLDEAILEMNSNGNWSFVKLTPLEFHVWSHIFYFQKEENRDELHDERCIKVLSSLRDKNVLLEANTPHELLDKMLAYKPIRQGMGFYREDKEEKRCIALGMEFMSPAILQTDIWFCSNGETPIDIMYHRFSNIFKPTIRDFESDFTLGVFDLIQNGLLFLR